MLNFSASGAHMVYVNHLRDQLNEIISKDKSEQMAITVDIVDRAEKEILASVNNNKSKADIILTPQETRVVASFRRNYFYCWTPDFTYQYGRILQVQFLTQMYICNLSTPYEMRKIQEEPEIAILELSWNNPQEMFASYAKSLEKLERIIVSYNN